MEAYVGHWGPPLYIVAGGANRPPPIPNIFFDVLTPDLVWIVLLIAVAGVTAVIIALSLALAPVKARGKQSNRLQDPAGRRSVCRI